MKSTYTNQLQQRASAHLEKIVERMLQTILEKDRDLWKGIVVHLVKEVVSTVDPNVRQGDSLDIRNYVKMKIIPGGSVDENVYVDGVVFRKNVSHKKMSAKGPITKPRVLLLAGGIEFQRFVRTTRQLVYLPYISSFTSCILRNVYSHQYFNISKGRMQNFLPLTP